MEKYNEIFIAHTWYVW